MKYELCATNDYGYTSVENSSEDLFALIKEARDFVTNENFDNPLTPDDQQREWSAFFVELIDRETEENIEDALYAGLDSKGQHQIMLFDPSTQEFKEMASYDDMDGKVQIYIGDDNGVSYYGKDHRLKPIGTLYENDLSDKTVYYIRPIRK